MLTISARSVIRLHPLERQVLDGLLTMTDQELSVSDLGMLRVQMRDAIILSREMTGHGFYTKFMISENALRLPSHQSLWFGAVCANVPSLTYGAGFHLYIKNGAVDLLEGFSYDGPWPDPWPTDFDEGRSYGVSQIPRSEKPDMNQ